jgi:ABC-type spermidine/putrescine transport system permease subunit I
VDVFYTIFIVGVSTLLIGLFSLSIGGYITLCGNPKLVSIMRWLYRWPLFIPFIVAAQCMRTFLAKNGLMNNTLVTTGLLEPLQTVSFLDWRGIIFAFTWKQTAFAALLITGAMASLDQSGIHAARNLGANRFQILIQIIIPQITSTLTVALILSCVTMMSVLSVPLIIGAGTPTMLTADMAFRINSYGDYGVANALGFISYALTGTFAWIYLRKGMQEGGKPT